MSKCILCRGAGLLPGLLSCERLCPLCDGVAGWPEALPSVMHMNEMGDVGAAILGGSMFREIRAVYDEDTIRVYQAYNVYIAKKAAEANSFRAPLESGKWSDTRMTWIKPSAVWMAYRCDWSYKDKNQAAVLALDLSRQRFLELLRTAILSHGEEAKAEKGATKAYPVVVQWDPERIMSTDKGTKEKKKGEKESRFNTTEVSAMRSIQIGLRDAGSQMLLDPTFVRRITDVTQDFQNAHAALNASPPNIRAAVEALWPGQQQEERMIVPFDIRERLGMDVPYDPDYRKR